MIHLDINLFPYLCKMKDERILKLYKQIYDASVDYRKFTNYQKRASQVRTMIKYVLVNLVI